MEEEVLNLPSERGDYRSIPAHDGIMEETRVGMIPDMRPLTGPDAPDQHSFTSRIMSPRQPRYRALVVKIGQATFRLPTCCLIGAASLACLLALLLGSSMLQRMGSNRVLNNASDERPYSIARIAVAPGRDARYWDWAPLRLMHAGLDKISLATFDGKYVSAHLDGTLSARSSSVGPNEIFEETPTCSGNNSSCSENYVTYALKSSFGKFLRREEDGTVTADDDNVSSSGNMFHKVLVGSDIFLQNGDDVIAAVGYKLTLLTTEYLSTNAHTQEQYAALIVNLMNDAIYDVHVLTESDCEKVLAEVDHWISRMPNITMSHEALKRKLVCAPSPTRAQPLYKDFFEYATIHLPGSLVLFANGDIVFDETLHLIEPEQIVAGKIGLVLSVQPPPQNGSYKEAFGVECSNTPRCAVGDWQGGDPGSAGVSWDAYVFAPPLPSSFNPSEVDVVMNVYGAEQVAAFQLEVRGGITLYNPCYHVHAFHWHCQGGKTHSMDYTRTRVDKPPHRAARGIYPCWNCPGVAMPQGSAKAEDLCRSGSRRFLNSSRAHFRQPHIAVEVCCSDQKSCQDLPMQWLDACIGADDVDCVMWEFKGKHVFY